MISSPSVFNVLYYYHILTDDAVVVFVSTVVVVVAILFVMMHCVDVTVSSTSEVIAIIYSFLINMTC